MEIEDFLAAQRESGQVDSQGVFTVSVDKARQKLGQFQLDDPSFYLLKVIQAAVEGGTTRLDLRRTRQKLALWFDAPAPLGRFEQLMMAMRNPLEAPAGPLKSLALGFNSALFSDPLQTSLVWWGSQESRALVAVGDEVTSARAPERPEGVSSGRDLYLFSVTKARPGWFENATSPEHEAIVRACGFCPVEILIDGQPLKAGRLPPARAEHWLSKYSEPFHLVERLELDPDGGLRAGAPTLRLRKRGIRGWLRGDRSPETYCAQPLELSAPEERCRAAYALPLGLHGADKVHFVCHGVKVATVTVNSGGAGAAAVVSADHLVYDLSGFGVVRNADYQGLVEQTNEVWRDMVETVIPDLDGLTSTVTDREREEDKSRRETSCGCSFLGCFGAIFMLAVLPGLGGDASLMVALTSMAGSATVPFLRQRADRHRSLRDAVLHRLEQLREHWPKG